MTEGFLDRWSRRKGLARAGQPLPEPALPGPEPASAQEPAADAAAANGGATGETPARRDSPAVPAEPPLPTLDDARALTPASDFKPFLARGVAPEVKNAALKTLFADPHFNVMDGLDTYIDDYGRPDPLPAALLREMVSARFLGMAKEGGAAREAADGPDAANVAESGHRNELPESPAPVEGAAPGADDAHADLRLQPDDATRRESPGGGAA